LTSLLDTNVISQRIKPAPHEGVMKWLSQLPAQDAFLSVVTIQEIRTGIELLAAGQKRRNLELWLGRDIRRGYAGRILPITEEIADRCGRLVAQIRRDAKTPAMNDMLIAATAQVHGLQLATLDWDHFEGLDLQFVKL
jgi:predicted nucleic acid-binding protein